MGTEKVEFGTAADLLAAADQPLPIDKVYSPQLKKWFWCQGLSSLARSKWERSFMRRGQVDPRRIIEARASLLILCVVNDDVARKKLYSDDDREKLGKVPAVIIEPIYDLCRKLSGIGDDAVEELEQLSAETAGSGSATS